MGLVWSCQHCHPVLSCVADLWTLGGQAMSISLSCINSAKATPRAGGEGGNVRSQATPTAGPQLITAVTGKALNFRRILE